MGKQKHPIDIERFVFDASSDEPRAMQLGKAIVNEPAWPGVNPGPRLARLGRLLTFTAVEGYNIILAGNKGRRAFSPEQQLGDNRRDFNFAMEWRFGAAFDELTPEELAEMRQTFANPIDPISDERDPDIPLPNPWTPVSWGFAKLNQVCMQRVLNTSEAF